MNIFYKEYGNLNGNSIVFIHGGGMSSEVWNNTLKYFKDYHCIVVDLPEHGKSRHIKPFTMNDSAWYIANIIEKNANKGKAHVVGHSLGGMVVVQLLSNFSNLIDHAVIASGNLRPSILYTILSNTIACNLQNYILKKNKRNDFITKGMLKRMYQNVKENLFIPNELGNVEVPTLIIAGSKEYKFLRKSNIDLVKTLPNSKGILIEGAKHNYPWIDRNTFNNVIKSWISDREIINQKVIVLEK